MKCFKGISETLWAALLTNAVVDSDKFQIYVVNGFLMSYFLFFGLFRGSKNTDPFTIRGHFVLM